MDIFLQLDYPKEKTLEHLRDRYNKPGEYKTEIEKLPQSKYLEQHIINTFLACKTQFPSATEVNKGFYFQIKITPDFQYNLNAMLKIINFKLKYRCPNRPPRIFILGPSGIINEREW